jgi:hypothetical protein
MYDFLFAQTESTIRFFYFVYNKKKMKFMINHLSSCGPRKGYMSLCCASLQNLRDK